MTQLNDAAPLPVAAARPSEVSDRRGPNLGFATAQGATLLANARATTTARGAKQSLLKMAAVETDSWSGKFGMKPSAPPPTLRREIYKWMQSLDLSQSIRTIRR